jgi:hypothetical protein
MLARFVMVRSVEEVISWLGDFFVRKKKIYYYHSNREAWMLYPHLRGSG